VNHIRSIAAIVIVAAVSTACWSSPQASVPDEPSTPEPNTQVVRVGHFRSVVVTEATTEHLPALSIMIPEGMSVTITDGQQVAVGDQLARPAGDTAAVIQAQRAADDARLALDRLNRQKKADETSVTDDEIADARKASERATEDLAQLRSASIQSVDAPTAGLARVTDGAVSIEPDGWRAVATVSAIDRHRIGPSPVSAELTLDLPSGKTTLPCLAISDTSTSEKASDQTTIECTFEPDSFMVKGLRVHLAVVAAELERAISVPLGAIRLDRGSISRGVVTVINGEESRDVAVEILGTNGFDAAVTADLTESDQVVIGRT
jgi:uncharacterized protein YunC (DUF1805 family)